MASALLNRYACGVCGYRVAQFKAQCIKCRQWDTFQGCAPVAAQASPSASLVASTEPVKGFAVRRIKTGVPSVDALLSGGFVKGRSVVLAGDPGAGKSTLSLHLAGGMARDGCRVLYVCGEETVGAVQHRAQRIGAAHPKLLLTAVVEVGALRPIIEDSKAAVVFFDSVQMLHDVQERGEPGDVQQVKRVVKILGPWCSARQLVSVFLGHVNKQGKIGGPQFFRHMTDVTLEFKVDDNGVRRLQTRKNRDGATDKAARFKMTAKGLEALQ